MKFLFIIIGFAIGVAQFGLLKTITAAILIKSLKFTGILLRIILKLLIYAVAVYLMLKLFAAFIAFTGIGFGAGIVCAAIVYALMKK